MRSPSIYGLRPNFDSSARQSTSYSFLASSHGAYFTGIGPAGNIMITSRRMVSLARLSQAPASSLSLCECTTSTQVARSTTSSCSSPFSLPFTSYPRHRCRSSFTSLYNPTTNDASRRTYSSSHPPKGPSHNYSHLPPDLRPPEARPLRETLPKSVRQSLPFSQPLLRKQLPPIVKSQSRSTRPRPPPLLAPPLPPPPMPQLVHSPSIDLTSPLPSSYPTSIPSPFTQETWSKYSSTPPSPFEFLSASASFHTPLPSFHQFNDPLPPSRTPRSIPLPPSDPKPSSLITSASQATKSAYHSALAKLFPSPSPPPEKRKILKKEREAPELELPPVLGSPIPMIMARVVPLPKPRIQVLLEREAKEAARLASLSSSTKKSASILPPPPEAAPTSRPQTADAPSPSQSTDAPSPSSDPSYPRYPTPTHYVPPSKPRQFNRAVPPPPVAPLPTPNLRRIPRGVVYTSKGEEARAVDAKREAQEQERELERGRLEAFGFGRLVGEKKKAAVSEMEGNGKGGRKGSQAVAQVGAGMGKEKELEREREGPEASGKSRKGKALVLEGTPALSGQQKQKQKQKRKGVPGEVKELSVQPAAKGRAKGQAGAVISIDEMTVKELATLLEDLPRWLKLTFTGYRKSDLRHYTSNLQGLHWREMVVLTTEDLVARGISSGRTRKLLKAFARVREKMGIADSPLHAAGSLDKEGKKKRSETRGDGAVREDVSTIIIGQERANDVARP